MTIFFAACAAGCAGFWIILFLTAGALVAEHWLWLLFALFFFVNALAARGLRSEEHPVPLWLATALHTTCFALLAAIFATNILIAAGVNDAAEVQNPDYVVVPGFGVRGRGVNTEIMDRRMAEVLRAAEQNPRTRFVLAGCGGRNAPVSEAEVMADWLMKHGVPQERLLIEVESGNLYESVVYSEALIRRIRSEAQPFLRPATRQPEVSGHIPSVESRPVHTAILTEDVRLYHAVSLAEKATGMQVAGIPVPSDPVFLLHGLFRESLSILKDKFMGRL